LVPTLSLDFNIGACFMITEQSFQSCSK